MPSRRLGRRIGLSLALLVAAAAPPSLPRQAQAQDAPPPAKDVHAARAPDVGRAAAQKLWPAVEDARKSRLFACAALEAAVVLEQDADHRGARALLGFVRKGDAWVEDAALAAKTPRRDFGDATPGIEEQAAALRRWRKEVLPAARRAAANAWAALGEECAAQGDAAGARKAFERAVALDAGHEKARAGLGFYAFSGVWLTEAQVRQVQATCRAEVYESKSPVDDAFGVTLNKVRTAHFEVESRLPADRLQEVARAMETAYAVHLADVGLDPTQSVFKSRVRFVLCDAGADWDAWVARFVPRNKEFFRGLEGAWGEGWQYGMKRPEDDLDETRIDHVVHRAIHAVDAFALGFFWPSWIDEGLAHLTTIRVQGMTRTWCLGPSQSEYAKLDRPGGAKKGWIDESEWRGATRAAAIARDDVPLRTLVLQPFPSLGFGAVLKAWSIHDYWRTTDPVAWRALLRALRDAKDPAAVIEKHYGKGLEAIDEDWRRYVAWAY